MSFVTIFRPFQCLSLCLTRLIPKRISSVSSTVLASWHEHEVIPFLSITAVIVCALAANLFIVLPHVQPATLSFAFQLLILPSALLTFLFLVLLRAVDPGVLRPSLSPPTPRTQTLLDSHQHSYIPPKRYARQHVHSDGLTSYTPLLAQLNTNTTTDQVEAASHDTHTDSDSGDEQGELVVQQWCFGCQIWRPPLAGHCRHCEVCIERFDHHCYVIGACVGRHNLISFLLFLLAAGVSGVILTSSSLIMLLQRAPFSASSASEPLVWLGVVLTSSSLYICATLLFLAHHVHMLCTNTTTRQQHHSQHNQPTTAHHYTTPSSHTTAYDQLRSRYHELVWPPGRRWKQAWVVEERSERRRLMEKRWRREGVERERSLKQQQQRYQRKQDDGMLQDDSEDGSVHSQERLWKGDEGDEEVKERANAEDADDEENELESATMSVSSFLSDDEG